MGVVREPLPAVVVRRLRQLHVPVSQPRDADDVLKWTVCGYDGFTWPCRESRILDGYEEDL